jgi:hypothetical protein
MFGDKVDFQEVSMLECLFIGCALFEGREACCLITLDLFFNEAETFQSP